VISYSSFSPFSSFSLRLPLKRVSVASRPSQIGERIGDNFVQRQRGIERKQREREKERKINRIVKRDSSEMKEKVSLAYLERVLSGDKHQRKAKRETEREKRERESSMCRTVEIVFCLYNTREVSLC